MPPTPGAHDGTLHIYTPGLVAFEHKPSTRSSSPAPTNTLLWIGGLSGGLLTVAYPALLARALPPSWRLAEVLLSSAYRGWGTSSLTQDAHELAACVAYFQQPPPPTPEARGQGEAHDGRAKVVLMGHSTGSQSALHYLVGPGAAARPRVHGVVLQAGISDREALVQELPRDVYENGVRVARQWVREGRAEDVLPLAVTGDVFGAPASARRWLSLASSDGEGDDDLFSSDLGEERLRESFGRVGRGTAVLVLFSGRDQFVPAPVDKRGLVERWMRAVKEGGGVVDEVNGGVVEGASHDYGGDPEEVVSDMVRRVTGFLESLDRGDFA